LIAATWEGDFVADGELVVAGGHCPVALEPVDPAFHRVALGIQVRVEHGPDAPAGRRNEQRPGRLGQADAPASCTAVAWRAVRLMPRSGSLTARGLTPAALASSSCVNSASVRSCRSNPANPEVACSAMTAAPLPPPSARQRQKAQRGQGLYQYYPGQAPAPPCPAPASPRPGPAAAATTVARDRHAGTATGAVLPSCPGTWSRRPASAVSGAILWVSCVPHG